MAEAVHKHVALALARFLDSEEAHGLLVRREDVRALAEAFLQACHEELGKPPRLLDGQELHEAVAGGVAGRLAPRDPRVEHAPQVLGALLEHVKASEVVAHSFELEQALEPALAELRERVASGANASLQRRSPSAPFVHRADKVGRNDPCACGSGKKYKHCHGRPD